MSNRKEHVLQLTNKDLDKRLLNARIAGAVLSLMFVAAAVPYFLAGLPVTGVASLFLAPMVYQLIHKFTGKMRERAAEKPLEATTTEQALKELPTADVAQYLGICFLVGFGIGSALSQALVENGLKEMPDSDWDMDMAEFSSDIALDPSLLVFALPLIALAATYFLFDNTKDLGVASTVTQKYDNPANIFGTRDSIEMEQVASANFGFSPK